jgi:S1-C subfamily serine protease
MSSFVLAVAAFGVCQVPFETKPVTKPDAPSPLLSQGPIKPDQQWAILAACPRIASMGGTYSFGTGVIVGVKDGNVYLLTANHVVLGQENRDVEIFTKESYPKPRLKLTGAEVVQRHPTADLAIVRTRTTDQSLPDGTRINPPLELSMVNLPKPWQRPNRFPVAAISVGCNDALPPKFQTEEILRRVLVRRGSSPAFFWQMAAPPVSGRSGGPLLDSDGKLLGICAAHQDGLGYYTHLDEIHAWLKMQGFAWLWEGGTVGAR